MDDETVLWRLDAEIKKNKIIIGDAEIKRGSEIRPCPDFVQVFNGMVWILNSFDKMVAILSEVFKIQPENKQFLNGFVQNGSHLVFANITG